MSIKKIIVKHLINDYLTSYYCMDRFRRYALLLRGYSISNHQIVDNFMLDHLGFLIFCRKACKYNKVPKILLHLISFVKFSLKDRGYKKNHFNSTLHFFFVLRERISQTLAMLSS